MNDLNPTHRLQDLLNETRLARTCLNRAKENVKSAQQRAEVAKRRREEARQAINRKQCQIKRAKAELKEAKAIAAKAELAFAVARERVAQGRKRPTMRENRPLHRRPGKQTLLMNGLGHPLFQTAVAGPTLERRAGPASALRDSGGSLDLEKASSLSLKDPPIHFFPLVLDGAKSRTDTRMETGPWPECYD